MIYLVVLLWFGSLLVHSSGIEDRVKWKIDVVSYGVPRFGAELNCTDEKLQSGGECPRGMYCEGGSCLCNETATVISEFCKASLGEYCYSSSQCNAIDKNSFCDMSTCRCKEEYSEEITELGWQCIETKVKLGNECYLTKQCKATDRNAYCNTQDWSIYNGICQCGLGYRIVTYISDYEYKKMCMKDNSGGKSKEMYKAAMVALACFMVTAIGLIILFLCNRNFLRNRRRAAGDHPDGRRMSDVFNISENLAAMNMCDKPPTYDEVLNTDRVVRGVPPPEYNETALSTGASTSNPEPVSMSGRIWRFTFIRRTGSDPVRSAEPSGQQTRLNLNDETEAGGRSNQAFISDA